MNEKKFRTNAFTLAEVLTTLMVIGIVAALTIPNLMNSYKKNVYTVSLKKMYSVLISAMKMVPTEVGCDVGNLECASFFPKTSSDAKNLTFFNAIAKQLNPAEIKPEGGGACKEHFPCVVLKDGSNVTLQQSNTPIIGSPGTYEAATPYFYVDINGEKGPNQPGRDIFVFLIATETKNGVEAGFVIPVGSKLHAQYINNPPTYWRDNPSGGCRDGEPVSAICTARLLEEGKMNY